MPPFFPLSSSTSQTNNRARMAGRHAFHVEVDNDLRGCVILLKSVVCEWLLIFFILVDAVYLYFLKKFANYCNLQLPCMLCSRLDHIFGNEKPDFYKDLICNEHRSKISSLVFCHNHGSLADVHDVCEECLLSFATKKDSGPEIYKFLIGKLGLDGLRSPVSDVDFFHGFVSVKSCSCCNKQWRCRPNVHRLVKSQSFGSKSPKLDNIPLPTTPHQKLLNRGNAVLKARERLFLGESNSIAEGGNSPLKASSDHDQHFNLDGGDQQQGVGFSFKKQFEEKFKTKKVISPTNTQQSQSELRFSITDENGTPIAKNLNSSRGIMEMATTPLDKQDDKANGDSETWEAFDLITPRIQKQGENYDKKDGITMTNFHTQMQTPSLDDNDDNNTPFRLPFKEITSSNRKSESPEKKMKGDETQLRKQIDESQEYIERLQTELEEERNAAAEAASQAMAMITKLQEEKAVLNMDAQQYLRMMEEQAEHDLEALESTNDLLAEREKEMQDMEAELEFYRMKYPDEYEEEFAHAELLSQGMGMIGSRNSP